MQIVGKSVEGQEDDSLLKAFIDLGEQCPKFLRSQLEAVIELMLKVRQTQTHSFSKFPKFPEL